MSTAALDGSLHILHPDDDLPILTDHIPNHHLHHHLNDHAIRIHPLVDPTAFPKRPDMADVLPPILPRQPPPPVQQRIPSPPPQQPILPPQQRPAPVVDSRERVTVNGIPSQTVVDGRLCVGDDRSSQSKPQPAF